MITGKSRSCGCFERESRYNRKHANTDVIGKKYGRLTVIKDSGKRASNGSVVWECKCDCGNLAYSDSSNLKRGHTTSCGCAIQDYVDTLKIDIIGNRYSNLVVLKELDRTQYKRRTYLCLCDCGNTCIAAGTDLTSSHTTSCGCRKCSGGEMMVKDILDTNNVNYIQEYRFDDCKYKKKLPFDFYLPDHNICIEYQGKQHYESVDYWGGEKEFAERQLRDDIKQKYCEENNITLLQIPYNLNKEKVNETILNVLNP